MARLKKKDLGEVHHQQRGWGGEHWIENSPQYCGKLLYIMGGKCGSMHFHKNKSETMFLTQGDVTLLMIDPDTGEQYCVSLKPGDSIFIPAPQVHQIIAHTYSEIIEFSTMHEESDSYRIKKGD